MDRDVPTTEYPSLRYPSTMQVDIVRYVLATANKRGDAHVKDRAQAARSIVAQLEGQIMFAKLHDDTEHLDTLWTNSLALLSASAVAT